ncbi:MAG: hypothetical protein CVU65_01820 [Deltaproteobacteria bacterium HGW-Deltaproteobacteria-22]|jgi:alpha-tubulin suppressor-like RCC1 family protein|nr:MAG: hypothetical protein CVU65_01820 [Deltaproteobacteria bacterium HGW-Deltaproteobacteria-22]
MRNPKNLLHVVLPLTLLVLAGCPSKTKGDPSLPKTAPDKPAMVLPAGVFAIPGIDDAQQLAVGDQHACVIRAGGRVFCWGDNTTGGLGLPEKKIYDKPVEFPQAADAVQIAASTTTTCVRKKTGVVFCWSGNQGPATNEPLELKNQTMTKLKDARTIGVGPLHVCGALADGSVRCEEVPVMPQYTSIYSMPTEFTGVGDVVSLEVGFQFLCARLKGGEVRCMGTNRGGQTGNGADGEEKDPVSPKGASAMTPELFPKASSVCPGIELPACEQNLSGVTDLSLSPGGACAVIGADGAVACWGSFDYRGDDVLGIGENGFARVPVLLGGITGARAVATGLFHVCALTGDGGVSCFGKNDLGQLGDGTKTDRKTAGPVPQLTGMTQLGAGHSITCALHGTGSVVCWGTYREETEE